MAGRAPAFVSGVRINRARNRPSRVPFSGNRCRSGSMALPEAEAALQPVRCRLTPISRAGDGGIFAELLRGAGDGFGDEGGHAALRIADRQADRRLAGLVWVQERRQLRKGRRRQFG